MREPDMDGGALPEGEEAPPRGVRTMAAVRWAIVGLMLAAAVAAWLHWSGAVAGSAAASAGGAAAFHCPMHPAVVQAREGECPICGMDLVRADDAPPPATSPPASVAGAATVGRYWCPMHPDVSSDDPTARCEKCGGMKLLPREPEPVAVARAAVPGLEAVEVPAARTQLMGIRTARATAQRLSPKLRTSGVVNADDSAVTIVASRTTGWIQDLRVRQTGQRVAKGEVLATIYGPELLTAQQAYVNALRWSTQGGTTNVAGVDADARKRLELLGVAPQDVADLVRRGRPVDAVPIRSPISGYVARRETLAGEYVQAGTELFAIADLSTAWVVADVYEPDVERVAVGQRARVSLAGSPGQSFAARVDLVYPALNPTTRTLQVRLRIEDRAGPLRPGAYADVEIELAPLEALAIPVEAVVDTGELQYVFVARGSGRFEPRRVRVGLRADERAQVLDGLAEGDEVVTTANFLIDSESRMRAAVEAFGAPKPQGSP